MAHLPAAEQAGLEAIVAKTGDGGALVTALRSVAPPEHWAATSRLAQRILFRFSRCTRCGGGLLAWERLSGLPNQTQGAQVGSKPLSPEVVAAFLKTWNAA